MPSEKEKWLKFFHGQYQFKVSFTQYADFESILKPIGVRCKEKTNEIQTYQKGKLQYTENINKNTQSEWCVHSTFTHGKVLDPIKMYHVKHCIEKIVEQIEDKAK